MSAPLTLADKLRVRATAGWGVVVHADEARQIARMFDQVARIDATREQCVETLLQAGELMALSRQQGEAAQLVLRTRRRPLSSTEVAREAGASSSAMRDALNQLARRGAVEALRHGKNLLWRVVA